MPVYQWFSTHPHIWYVHMAEYILYDIHYILYMFVVYILLSPTNQYRISSLYCQLFAWNCWRQLAVHSKIPFKLKIGSWHLARILGSLGNSWPPVVSMPSILHDISPVPSVIFSRKPNQKALIAKAAWPWWDLRFVWYQVVLELQIHDDSWFMLWIFMFFFSNRWSSRGRGAAGASDFARWALHGSSFQFGHGQTDPGMESRYRGTPIYHGFLVNEAVTSRKVHSTKPIVWFWEMEMDELEHLSASFHNFRPGIRRVCFILFVTW